MFVDFEKDPREDPPVRGDERTTLEGFLRWQRETLQLKCSDLDASDPVDDLTEAGEGEHGKVIDRDSGEVLHRYGQLLRPAHSHVFTSEQVLVDLGLDVSARVHHVEVAWNRDHDRVTTVGWQHDEQDHVGPQSRVIRTHNQE